MTDLLEHTRTLYKLDECLSVFLVSGHAAVLQERADEDIEILKEPNHSFLIVFFYSFDFLSQSKVEVLIHKGNFLQVHWNKHKAYFEQKTLYLGRTVFKAKLQIFEDEISLESFILFG